MKKGVFITTSKMSDDFYHLEKNEWGKILNTRDNDIPKTDGLLTVMKQFSLKKPVKSAVLRITSLGNFEAVLNGHHITEDELTPLWTDYRHRVFEYEYDILSCIKKKGVNTFGARVSTGWWSSRISIGYYGYKKTALCAEIEITYKDGTSEIIATDESWNTAICGPVLYADIWDGEYFDATIKDPLCFPESIEWVMAQKFTDHTCDIVDFEGQKVKICEYIAPKSAVVYRGTKDNGTDYGEIKTVKKSVGENCECITLKAGQTMLLDFGEDVVGRPSLAINALNGTEVKCLFAEMLNDSGDISRGNDGPKGSLYIANYRSALARFNYVAASISSCRQLNIIRPLHTFYGFRYMEITADKDINIECITAEVLSADLEYTGDFECSNSLVNKLYKNIVRGMKGNYLGIPTDCPQRDERYGWTGDTQIFCGAASYIADTDKFLGKYLVDMSDSQNERDGAYADICPAVFENGMLGSTAWGDAGLIIPYRLWLMFGDKKVIERQYSSMEYYMDYIDKNFGLNVARGGYGDWLSYEETSKSYISFCFNYNNAVLMQKFSDILGKADKEKYYADLSKKILNVFYEKYVVDDEILEKSQTAYILPLAFDMLDGKVRENAIKNLEKKIIDNNYTLSTGFIGTGLLNQTLAKVGLNNLAYSLLLQDADPSWLYSVKQGATTIWERWNSYTKKDGFGAVKMNSFNHYSYGAVAEWMYAYVAGIRPDPDCVGFDEHFILAPMPDTRKESEIPDGQTRITSVKATYRDIISDWHYEEERFVWHCVIPDGSACVEFPLLYGQKTVEINGITFTAKELDGEILDGKMVFELTAGEYIIK